MSDNQSRAGKARLIKMSAEERRRVASEGAKARWAKADPERKGMAKAVYGDESRPLKIGDIEIPCFVLEDERRVLTTGGMQTAMKMARGGSMIRGMNRFELFVSRDRIKPYVSNELYERIKNPISFITPTGARAHGYEAEILVELCEAVLAARATERGLQKQQMPIAQQCELIMRGLARVGIVALVDEATGFQDIRKRNALAEILEKFIAKELQPWVHTFPDDYYEQLFRLRGLDYKKDTVKRPQYFGHLTNDIIYKRLAPGVREELDKVTPKSPSGRRKHHMHRKLTPDTGHPKLREHLASVTTIMKLSGDYSSFKDNLDKIHPRYDDTLMMDFGPQIPDDGEGI
ncbi:hypothetical protein C3731_20525 [Brucella oryzae]|uniref:Bacteriophage Mx8 p63 C-terminal domain-containing protein n=2 Tax=Brucella oryzae TaxID=335286 RepID=A0A2S7IUP5_9HYPH|nr:hypothetical protein C3731_20525 [Brucella oryzae]